jgi:hypothetical protein
MLTLAWLVLLAAAGWLAWVGWLMAFRPLTALDLLSRTATTYRINATEQVPRLIAGAAMIVRAEVSRFPLLFEVAGWFIVASSVVLLVIPLRWHNSYAVFWARRIPPGVVRMIAPFSVLGGIALIWAAGPR